jgi:glycosyltransferase involved in cell wall biosynthesis
MPHRGSLGERVKVVHVIPSLAARTGGPAYGMMYLARELERVGVAAPIFATDQAGPAQLGAGTGSFDLLLPEVAGTIDVRLVPAGRPARLAYAPGLRKALHEEAASADLIHIHALFLYPTYAGYRAARDTGTPYVISPHGSLDPWIRRRGKARKAVTNALWQRRMFAQAAAMHATTEEEEALWPEYARRTPALVVPNGIDLAAFATMPSGDPFRAELGLAPGAPLIVHIGRVAAKKGPDILVRATATLHRAGIPAHVALVGHDDEALIPELRALAFTQGIQPFVHFPGFRDGAAKLAALTAADVFALPSHTENFGIAVLEALAAGTPTVTSTEVNLGPQIAAAGAGLVVPPTVEDTADALTRVLTDTDLQARLRRAGPSFAAAFDWSAVAHQWVREYEALLERSR